MLAIGSDHAAAELRKAIAAYLTEQKIPFVDCGTDEAPSNYPQIAEKVCKRLQNGEVELGILLCGTGIGMSIAANKCKGIRAAVCTETYSAKYARMHNDANILCMGARTVGPGLALEILEAFLGAEFEGGRHLTRVKMIAALEETQ